MLVLLVAGAIGYLLGTESGRTRRDVILIKLGRKEPADDAGAPPDAADTQQDVADAIDS